MTSSRSVRTPLGQILLSGRDEGRNFNTTSMALGAGTRDVVVMASDGKRGGNATIFHARSFEQ